MPLEHTLGGRIEHRQGFINTLIVRGREVLQSVAASRHGIGARLLTAVLIFSGCVTLILTAIQLYIDYRRDVSAMAWRANEVSLSYRDSLAEGLWNLDERQLRLQLNGILRLPDVRAVEVRETGNSGNSLIIKLGETPTSSARVWEYPLSHNAGGRDTTIGTLRIEATLAEVYQRLVDTALTILVSQAAKTFLVSLFILFVVHYLVTRHLSTIAADLRGYRINGQPLELSLQRRPPRHGDELQRVITAFNTLSRDLHVAYRDLRGVNDELAQDVAARRKAEAVLREREARIRRLVDANIIGIFIWDLDGRILEANDAFLRIVGYDREDLVASRIRWTDLTPAEWQERHAVTILEHKTTGRVQPFEKEYFRKDGRRVPVLVGGALFEEGGSEGVAFVLDLTERKRAEDERLKLEERLQQAEKMEAIGRFASGIAHDFNNMLGGILAYGEMLLDEAPEGTARKRYAQNVLTAATRGRDLVDQILAYSRQQRSKREPTDICRTVAETLELMCSSLPGTITLERGIPDAPLVVMSNATRFQQVVMNLCSNAIHAMSSRGALRVAITTAELSAERALSHGTLKPGVYVCLSVEDSGCGMDEATLARIFEPFFTTKEVGRGTGLGLALVYAIVTDLHGAIDVKSAPAQGSTFSIYLRLADVPQNAADRLAYDHRAVSSDT